MKRGKVTDQIFETLRQDILTGRRERGSRLPNERELAELFAVSQPTIREAVRALDVMGLVDVRHGSGAYVRGDGAYLVAAALQTLLQVERVSVIDVIDVREMLGRESARMAAAAATEEDLELLEQGLRTLEHVAELPTVEAIVDELAAFQVAVSAAAHNPLLLALEGFLVNLLMQLQIKALRKRGARYWRERSLGFTDDRRAIVDALRARDADHAGRAMEGYLEHQRAVFLADPELAEMRLSDAKAVRAVADIVLRVRAA
jgi:GntR family transcriptional repressor for pyruvate dehydrogenase complex